MKRLSAVVVAFFLSGCAELEELLMPEVFDDPYYVAPPPYPLTPPPLQTAPVVPAGHFTSTTQEPELLTPRK